MTMISMCKGLAIQFTSPLKGLGVLPCEKWRNTPSPKRGGGDNDLFEMS
jgi:hypothetical protein